jgi:hypothetical protein
VKPPKGSNVTGEELFQTLIQDGEVKYGNVERWRFIRSRIVDVCDRLPTSLLPDENNHDYNGNEDEEIIEFLIGYVAKKAVSFQRECSPCKSSLLRSNKRINFQQSESLTDLKNYYGVLCYPSNNLILLIQLIEETILSEIGNNPKIHPNTFFDIAGKLEEILELPSVGCEVHADAVTAYVIQFYLVLRMHFVCKIVNSNITNFKKMAEMRKMGKLVQGNSS